MLAPQAARTAPPPIVPTARTYKFNIASAKCGRGARSRTAFAIQGPRSASRNKPIARLRSVAIIRGPEPVRTCE